jgi:hypothetical protein
LCQIHKNGIDTGTGSHCRFGSRIVILPVPFDLINGSPYCCPSSGEFRKRPYFHDNHESKYFDLIKLPNDIEPIIEKCHNKSNNLDSISGEKRLLLDQKQELIYSEKIRIAEATSNCSLGKIAKSFSISNDDYSFPELAIINKSIVESEIDLSFGLSQSTQHSEISEKSFDDVTNFMC